MKKLIVMALVMCFAVSAFAAIGVEWTTQSPGIFWYGAAGKSAKTEEADLALNHSDLVWQLVWAGADQKIAAVDKDAAGYVSGDDVVLADRTIYKNSTGATYSQDLGSKASDGTLWQVRGTLSEGSVLFQYPDTDPDGIIAAGDVYIYQRVFGSDANGLYYYQTDLLKANTAWDPKSTAQIMLLNPVAKQGAVLNEFISTGVPEPATMSLLGLGALAMVIRRKLSK